MKTYVAKTQITHDGESFEKGDELALTEDQAHPLLAVDAIEDPAEAEAKKPVRQPKKVAKK